MHACEVLLPYVFNLIARVQNTIFLYTHQVDVFMETFKKVNEKLVSIVLTATYTHVIDTDYCDTSTIQV